jgi:copper homeostasis protein
MRRRGLGSSSLAFVLRSSIPDYLSSVYLRPSVSAVFVLSRAAVFVFLLALLRTRNLHNRGFDFHDKVRYLENGSPTRRKRMEDGTILEICLDSVESCAAAERGGAQRVELCADLAEDGTTPSAGMVATVRDRINIGLFVMIRPRGGDFCYSDAEFDVMKSDVAYAKELGADGVVFGLLKGNGQIDLERTSELAGLARPMGVTFHRAFDMTVDPFRALEGLIDSGVDRVLTSGQARSATDGVGIIQRLVKQSSGRIRVMAGVGINADNARDIRDKTGVQEIHVGSGASEPVSGVTPGGLFAPGSRRTVSAVKVARIIEVLRHSH